MLKEKINKIKKKIKVTVTYPWSGIPNDVSIIVISGENLSEDDIRGLAYEGALDMIFDRGVYWDYEEVE